MKIPQHPPQENGAIVKQSATLATLAASLDPLDPLDSVTWQTFIRQVTPLEGTHPVPINSPPPSLHLLKIATPDLVDEASSHRHDFWLNTDIEFHHFRRTGVPHAALRQLRRLPLQDEFDLHGLTRAQALAELQQFLSKAQRRQYQCVQIIHGKGQHSSANIPVLKPLARAWLAQQKTVRAFIDSQDGGAVKVLFSW